jgi:hypothetical protein
MKILLRLVGCAVGFAALALTGALAQSPASVSIELVSTFDYPGTGNQTQPQKISDKRDVVGIFVDPSGANRGFIMFNNGGFSDPLVDPADIVNFTQGRGINNQRIVCGDYGDADGVDSHGFFFTLGNYLNFDVANSSSTFCLGINNVRDFAGSNIPTGGIQEAFLSIGGTVTEFAVTDATATLAYQLNTTNQSCGYYIDASGVLHGFWRDSDGTINAPIDPVGSTGTILFGNNDMNLMVGRYTDAAGATHGILFLPAVQRFVVFDFPGATFTSLNGINKSGEIVGRYVDPSTSIAHGILAQVVRSSAGVTLPLAPPSAPAQAVPQGAVVRPAY